jgi:succinate-acetate transporter protein
MIKQKKNLLCSIWINVVLVILFAAYTVAFTLLAAAGWMRSGVNTTAVRPLEVTAGTACYIVSLCGWYALIGCLFKEVKVPVDLPMGDLSGRGGINICRRASAATMEDA